MASDILILDVIHNDGGVVNKDVNSGLGSRTMIGHSWRAKILEWLKGQTVVLPSIVLPYAAAILKNKGHRVQYLRVFSQTDHGRILSRISQIAPQPGIIVFNPALVGYRSELAIVDFLRREFPSTRFGALGSLATVFPDLISQHFDWVINGEPEKILMESDIEDFAGVVSVKGLVDNLDVLPFPDWSIYGEERFSYRPMLSRVPLHTMLSSRGCPMSCLYYCSYPAIQGKRWRSRSAASLADEIDYLIKNFGTRAILFRDPYFSFRAEKTMAMAEEILRRKLQVQWGCETRLDSLDKQGIDLLYASGLRSVNIGVESEDHAILASAKRRPVERSHEVEMVEYCRKKGVKVNTFFILGLTDDTEQTILNTIQYSISLRGFCAQYTINTPAPGTPWFADMQGKFTETDLEKYDNNHLVFQHKNLTPQDMYRLKEKAFVDYYFRWRFLFDQIRWRCWDMKDWWNLKIPVVTPTS